MPDHIYFDFIGLYNMNNSLDVFENIWRFKLNLHFAFL